jgi:ATP-dependent RNA helicase DeaD
LENFHEWGLSTPLMLALDNAGYETPTPIQQRVIPYLLAGKSDLIALAQTGTGKTAAFGIPLLERIGEIQKGPLALILCPTRELCIQTSKELQRFSLNMDNIRISTIYGGTGYDKQEQELRRGPHIIVATPGRLMDHLKQGKVKTDLIKTLVLDEADEMMNMGFREDLDKIMGYLPEEGREIWLFSATMPNEIKHLSKKFMHEPKEIKIGNLNQSAERIEHKIWWCRQDEKKALITRLMDSDPNIYGIIFTRTRNDAQELADQLMRQGYAADSLHGDLSQAQRDKVMLRFRNKTVNILVATDVAARGIDVQDLTHVIHHSLPDDPEVYIHRSGRTARAGKKGISLILASRSRSDLVRKAEKLTGAIFATDLPPTAEEVIRKRVQGYFSGLASMTVHPERWDDLKEDMHAFLSQMSHEQLVMNLVEQQFGKFLDQDRLSQSESKNRRSDDREEGRGSRGGDRDRDRGSRGGDRDRGSRERSSSSRGDSRGDSRGRSSDFRGGSRDRERTGSRETFGDRRSREPQEAMFRLGLNLGLHDGMGKKQILRILSFTMGVPEREIRDLRIHAEKSECKLPLTSRKNLSKLEQMDFPGKKLQVDSSSN